MGVFLGGGRRWGVACQRRRGDVAEGGSARAGGGDSASGIMTTAYRGGWGWTARAFAGSSAAHLRRSGAGSARCGCGPFRRPCLRGGRRGAGRQGEGSGARRARDRAGDGASTNTPAGPRRRPYATTTGSIDERAPARRRGEGTHRRSEASARSTRGVRGSRPRRGVGARGGERARSWTPSARPLPEGNRTKLQRNTPRDVRVGGNRRVATQALGAGRFRPTHAGRPCFLSSPAGALRATEGHRAPARRLPPPREGGWEDLTQPSRASRGSVAPSPRRAMADVGSTEPAPPAAPRRIDVRVRQHEPALEHALRVPENVRSRARRPRRLRPSEVVGRRPRVFSPLRARSTAFPPPPPPAVRHRLRRPHLSLPLHALPASSLPGRGPRAEGDARARLRRARLAPAPHLPRSRPRGPPAPRGRARRGRRRPPDGPASAGPRPRGRRRSAAPRRRPRAPAAPSSAGAGPPSSGSGPDHVARLVDEVLRDVIGRGAAAAGAAAAGTPSGTPRAAAAASAATSRGSPRADTSGSR